jgi:hypothetical protein
MSTTPPRAAVSITCAFLGFVAGGVGFQKAPGWVAMVVIMGGATALAVWATTRTVAYHH